MRRIETAHSMERFTLLLIGIAAMLVTSAAPGAEPERPNVLLIMTDNHGAWTLGCYGNPDIKTPHIDRLANEGIRFTRAFSSNAVCSPTRATYLTGLLPSQHGVHCFLRTDEAQIGPDAYSTIEEFRSLPEILAETGYRCGLVGKWQLGDNRSLLDFAHIMEVVERHDVSFVSVTQQFNTASSMGRLMLNVLFSFAQFERELISERTRDTMGAARRKGKRLGGRPVLGYDVDPQTGRLVVQPEEAERVRNIFALYRERGGLIPTVRELTRRGWVTKRWTTRTGTVLGGIPFNKARMHYLLTNVTYVGQVKYQGRLYAGEQEAIVPQDLFDAVQRQRSENGHKQKARP